MGREVEASPRSKSLVDKLRIRGAENILRCIQCGTCTASCTLNAITSTYNPRRSIQLFLTNACGPKFDDVWLCSTCGICVERCPKSVSPMNVMLAARSILFEELGQIPEDRLRALETLYQCGYTKDGRGDIAKRRAVLGLPDISLSEGELAEVRRIMDDNGLARSTRNTDRSQVEGH